MWNRLQYVSWIFVIVLLLGSGTGVAHAAQHPADGQNASSTSTVATPAKDFSKFADLWVAHGAFMLIARDGSIDFRARTYNWCGPNAPQPCDSIVKDQLRYGYHEQMVLSRATDSVAYGTVTSSNALPKNLNTAITLTLGPDDTLIYTNNNSITFLCGPQAPVGTCGA